MCLVGLSNFHWILSKYLLVLTSMLIYVTLKDLGLVDSDVPLDLLVPCEANGHKTHLFWNIMKYKVK